MMAFDPTLGLLSAFLLEIPHGFLESTLIKVNIYDVKVLEVLHAHDVV